MRTQHKSPAGLCWHKDTCVWLEDLAGLVQMLQSPKNFQIAIKIGNEKSE
jgi:hypothetical protein